MEPGILDNIYGNKQQPSLSSQAQNYKFTSESCDRKVVS